MRLRFLNMPSPIVWPKKEESTFVIAFTAEAETFEALERWNKLRLWTMGAMALSSLRSQKH